MPNWCDNEVEITFEDRDEAKRFVQMITQSTDLDNFEETKDFFDIFVPTPPELLAGEGWYDWRFENWGTKWNPDINSMTIDTEDTLPVVGMAMLTAWSPPREFFVRFTNVFPSAIIELNYIEEGMGFCGKSKIYGGQIAKERYINEIPVEMYVAAGATLNAEGEVDWEADQDINLWEVIENDEVFNKFCQIGVV